MSSAVLRALADTVWHAVGERRDLLGGRTIALPPLPVDADVVLPDRQSMDFPVLRHLDDAVEAAQGFALGALARELKAHASSVRWSQNPAYTEDLVGRHFMDNYVYALLSGPEGPLICDVPYGGFILLGPGLHYPDHKHAPREIYLILTPGARWSLDSGEWFDVAPGDLIFHESWQPHATQVGQQPFLAFVAWLDVSSREGGIEI